MLTVRRKHLTQTKKPKKSRGDYRRVIIITVCLFAVFGATLIIGSANFLASRSTTVDRTEEMRIGSILFVPRFGDRCQQGRIDNENGTLSPLSPVSCEEVFSRGQKATKERPANRLMQMRDSFRASQK